MKITRFEDLDCWKASRELVRLTIASCEKGKLSSDFSMQNQLKRAALSAMNNIAEGFGRKSDLECIRFLDISQSSSIEVKSMTYALEDSDYVPIEMIMAIRTKAEDSKSLTLGLIRYLRNRSPRFK